MALDTTIKPGYKLSELGSIPNNWEVTTFENIANKSKKWSITGGPFGSNLKASDYTDFGVQIIQLQNIGDGKFYDDYQIFTSEKKANELLGCNIYPGEIILSKMGDPVARACFMPEKSKRYLMASDGIRLVVNENSFSKRFVHDYINSPYFRKRAFEVSTGSTRLRIGLPELKSILVIKPPLSEQTAIATVLSDTDELIEHLEKLIDKKKAIKQGTMQQLLTGKKRVPGFSGEWEVNNLKSMCWYQEGPGVRNYQFTSSGVKLLNGTNISKGKVELDTTNRYISEKEAFGWYRHFLVDAGDILIASSGVTIDKFQEKVAFAAFNNLPLCMNTSTIRFKSNPELLDRFLYFFLQSDSFKSQIGKQATGSAQLNFGPSHLNKINIDVPPTKNEQIEITKILSDMENEIEGLENKRDKYVMIKQGMMQQLLTGKIRIYGKN